MQNEEILHIKALVLTLLKLLSGRSAVRICPGSPSKYAHLQGFAGAFFNALGAMRQNLRQNFKINKNPSERFSDSDGFLVKKKTILY